ncbi:MAG: cytochrome c oxidase subunit 3 [Longimicrobiaceae bacterium]
MEAHAIGHAGTAHLDTSTGLDSRKMGMWVLIGSECLLFGSLIATYVVNLDRSVEGPWPHEILNIPLTSFSTFVLLMSSLLMVLALQAVQRANRKLATLWLFGVAFFGAIFLGAQVYEFTHFAHEGLTLGQNLFGSSFYLLTGTHGSHVAVGVLWMITLGIQSARGKLGPEKSITVEVAGLYWHFVDVIWIVIFTLVYLIHPPSAPL